MGAYVNSLRAEGYKRAMRDIAELLRSSAPDYPEAGRAALLEVAEALQEVADHPLSGSSRPPPGWPLLRLVRGQEPTP